MCLSRPATLLGVMKSAWQILVAVVGACCRLALFGAARRLICYSSLVVKVMSIAVEVLHAKMSDNYSSSWNMQGSRL